MHIPILVGLLFKKETIDLIVIGNVIGNEPLIFHNHMNFRYLMYDKLEIKI